MAEKLGRSTCTSKSESFARWLFCLLACRNCMQLGVIVQMIHSCHGERVCTYMHAAKSGMTWSCRGLLQRERNMNACMLCCDVPTCCLQMLHEHVLAWLYQFRPCMCNRAPGIRCFSVKGPWLMVYTISFRTKSVCKVQLPRIFCKSNLHVKALQPYILHI